MIDVWAVSVFTATVHLAGIEFLVSPDQRSVTMLRKIKTAVAGFTLAASMALAAPLAFAQDPIIIIICDDTGCVIIIIQ